MTALVAPLDAARAGVLRLLGRTGRTFLADRARRVALYGVIGVLTAWVATCAAPLWAFALGPILLGVPHLVADIRYLVVQPGHTKNRLLVIGAGLPLLLTLVYPTAPIGLAAGFGVIVAARTTPVRRIVAGVAWTALIALSQIYSREALMIILHGHNVIAVVLFLVVFARKKLLAALPAVIFLALALAILSGAFDSLVLDALVTHVGPKTGRSLHGIVASIAPVHDPMLALRLVFLFVFAQGVHYAIWLRLVPEEARERPGIRSFASSLTALKSDLGAPLLALSIVAAVALLFFATRSLEVARIGYLRAAAPHAYLEIAFALLFVLERGVPKKEARPVRSASKSIGAEAAVRSAA